MTTPSPHQADLAALAASAAADPRKAKSGVNKLAKPLPAADLPPFFEQACREFGAAGDGELAEWAFSEARKVEKKHPSLRDLDRLHAVFLEFTPTGAVAPGALRDHVKLMAGELSADEAHNRFWEILEASFAAGLVPYARVFPDLLGLAKAAGVKKKDGEARLTERLLRTGVLPAASHAIWRAARRPLGRIAAADRPLLDLLLAAEPDEDAQDADLAAEIRQYWLEALAEADAGAHVPPAWFFTVARRCAPEVLLRLVDQAGDRLAEPEPSAASVLDDPAVPPPGGSVYVPRPKNASLWNRVQAPNWRAGTDFAELTGALEAGPEERHAFVVQVDLFVQDLGYYSNLDYPAILRAFCSVPALRDLLRELVEGWKAQSASGSLPELDHALTRLVPLAEAGYADLEPGFATGMRLADPLEALLATVRGGLPSELARPRHSAAHAPNAQVLQHGAFLTYTWNNGASDVIGPAGPVEQLRGPKPERGIGTWYDGENAYFSRRVNGAWQTFRVENDITGPVLTMEQDTWRSRPHSPASAEVAFPGTPGPARVTYSRGGITVTAHDGTVTALLPYTAGQSLRDALPLPPPGWWPLMAPADPDGSAALREFTREAAARLLDAALTGPQTAVETIPSQVTAVRLRQEIVQSALSAVQCVYRLVRLRDVLGMEPRPGLPDVLRTRPDLPVARSLHLVTRFRRLAELMEEAAARPRGERGHPIAVAGDLATFPSRDFGQLGLLALNAARPWRTARGRASQLEILHAWANTPLGDGSGRWRRLALSWTADHPHTRDLELWRTPNGALIFGHHYYRPDWSETLEYSPDGAFGPVDMPDWQIKDRPVPQGWGGADRIAELGRLLDERGPVPQNPDWAHQLAEAAGIALIDAATICFGQWSRHDPAEIPKEIRALFVDPDSPRKCATWTMSYPDMDAVGAPLMPDDPAALWDRGPDIDRAAAVHRERAEP
ncbi:hypothetical protein GCM10010191_81700 [Actinomadura vinacea]|uniref:DUF4132 domain-containing protein n=1 Tax=Actinomadura vinacea TaxID=115336 RepID=A0ABN3K6V5_9ACTN